MGGILKQIKVRPTGLSKAAVGKPWRALRGRSR